MHFSHNMYSALVGVHLLHHSPTGALLPRPCRGGTTFGTPSCNSALRNTSRGAVADEQKPGVGQGLVATAAP